MAKEEKLKMSRDEAVAYLTRKGIDVSEEKIQECMKSGKCYGDPMVSISSW